MVNVTFSLLTLPSVAIKLANTKQDPWFDTINAYTGHLKCNYMWGSILKPNGTNHSQKKYQ